MAVLLAASLAAAPASAKRPGDDTARAKTCFTKAEAHFSLGEFALALEEYRKAYLLRPLPPLLFNMAQCHRHLGELEKAVFLLRRFLASSPTAMQRAQAEAVLQDVELALKSRPAPATRPATAPAASAPLPLPAARPRAPTAAARPPVVLHAITPTAPASQPTPSRTPLYKRWWLWTIVAGVAAATATTIAVLASRGDDLPRGTLPPVDYR